MGGFSFVLFIAYLSLKKECARYRTHSLRLHLMIFCVVTVITAVSPTLFCMGTANTFHAFFLLLYKVENDTGCNHNQNSDYNIVFHILTQCVLCFHLFIGVGNQSDYNYRKDEDCNKTADCRTYIKGSRSSDKCTNGVNKISYGVTNA